MAHEGKRVMLFGVTGAGKSTIGDLLLGLPELGLECPLADGKFAVGHSSGPGTTVRQTLNSEVPSGFELGAPWEDAVRTKKPICVEDTPGVPDPTGNAVAIMNDAVRSIKEDPPHGIIYVIDGANPRLSAAARLSLMALELCLQPVLTDKHLIVIYNKCPLSAGMVPEDEQNRAVQEALQNAENSMGTVANLLLDNEASHFQNKLVVPYERDLSNVKPLALHLWAMVSKLSSIPMNPEGASTWTEAETRLNRLCTGVEADAEQKQDMIKAKKVRVETLEKDIKEWQKANSTAQVAIGVSVVASAVLSAALGPAGVIACKTAIEAAGGLAVTGAAASGATRVVTKSSIEEKKREKTELESVIQQAEVEFAQFFANEVAKARRKKAALDELVREMNSNLNPLLDDRRRALDDR